LGEAQFYRDRPEAKLHCASSQRESPPRPQRLSITTKRATPCRQHHSRYHTANTFLSTPSLSRATCDSSAEVYRRILSLGNVRRVGKSEDLPPVDLKRTACLDAPAEQLLSHSGRRHWCAPVCLPLCRVLCCGKAYDCSCVVEALASDFPGPELLTSPAPTLITTRLAATVARYVGQ
jgi:hypothetical protein